MVAIPAMDIIDGSCVRLRMGDYASKQVYGTDPTEMAKMFADTGLSRLHLVDLDGAKAGRVRNLKVLERIAGETDLVIDVGGGLQSRQDFDAVFSAGAAMATVGSLAARDRELTLSLLQTFGPKRLVLGADCREGKIAVSGWETTTDLAVNDFVATYLAAGFRTVVSTDISRDGMMNGPSVELYEALLDDMAIRGLSMELVASGGIRSLTDLDILAEKGLSGAIIGKAMYEGAIEPKALAAWQASQGV